MHVNKCVHKIRDKPTNGIIMNLHLLEKVILDRAIQSDAKIPAH